MMNMNMMNKDEYGEVLNGEDTYNEIYKTLVADGRVMIGWTDELGTHYDILFVNTAEKHGPVQGGIQPETDLIVAIMRQGAFAFDIRKESHPNYIGEKLGVSGETGERLGTLINEVRRRL